MTDASVRAVQDQLKLRGSTEIQGDVLAGFRKDRMRVLFLRFPDKPDSVRAWLADLVPQVSTTAQVAAFNAAFSAARRRGSGVDPAGMHAVWLNVSLTFQGLAELLGSDPLSGPIGSDQVPNAQAFQQGAAARAGIVGDDGANAPENWLFGQDGQPVHALLTLAADRERDLNVAASVQRVAAAKTGLTVVFEQEAATLSGERAGHEHFGFKDGISQPGVAGFDPPDPRDPSQVDGKPGTRIIPAGEFVVGLPRANNQPPARLPDWATNGTFQVVRRMAQDVPGWWAQVAANKAVLDKAGVAVPSGAKTEWLAARAVGRWRSGAAVGHHPDSEPSVKPGSPEDNQISYADDQDGHKTPLFAHIRKMNPRDALGGAANQPAAVDPRRIIRRGAPYGEPFDPTQGNGHGPDDPRGLVFVAYMADLASQFEFLQQAWLNDVNFPTPNTGADPMIGVDSTNSLVLAGTPSSTTTPLTFHQFVRTEGTVYAFVPAISTLRELAAQH
jgi:Dyp-type peroxidase family